MSAPPVMGLKIAAGVLVGGLLGFLWYRLVGCSSGTCPLTSRWWVTTLYGAASGTLIALSK